MGLLDEIARFLDRSESPTDKPRQSPTPSPRAPELQPDEFPLPVDHPLAREHELLSALMRAVLAGEDYGAVEALSESGPGRAIASLAGAARVRMIEAAVERAAFAIEAHIGAPNSMLVVTRPPLDPRYPRIRQVAWEVAEALLRDPGASEAPADLAGAIDAVRGLRPAWVLRLPFGALVARAERFGAGDALPPVLRQALERLNAHMARIGRPNVAEGKIITRLRALVAPGPTAVFDRGEAWVDALVAETQALPDEPRRAWVAMQAHLLTAEAAKPTAKWLKEAARRRDDVGAEDFSRRARAWIEAARADAKDGVGARSGNFLRGLVWCVAEWEGARPEARADVLIGDLALAMSRKLWMVGARSAKVLHACITTLGRMPGTGPLAQLTRLRARVKAAPAQALIAEALAEGARRHGMSEADLVEVVTPTFGMDEVGVLRETLGDWTAEVRITGTDSVETRWLGAGGKAQKSPPAELKQGHAEALKELKETTRELANMLPAQRDRVERLMLDERVLPYAPWRERYLDHPLVGPLARRLIWHFADAGGRRAALGAWAGDALVDVEDRPLAWMGDDTLVRLWHPIGFPVDEVRAWRAWVERHELVQPFKQAHREVYVVTDAELATATYSNRFAAHIVRQFQLAALCKARGWHYTLQGAFDGGSSPYLPLPSRGLSAAFSVDPCLGAAAAMSETGIALYVSTDRVSFGNAQGNSEPTPLREVPAVVFSEVMRDVDLFVGVASIGADPAWVDRGVQPQWNEYWHQHAFGALGVTAETRREVLERLLPRLKIARRCHIDGKFLVVRGDVRTYKIHLGSGNILMEPNDRYLCIVPDRSGAGGTKAAGALYLPFEGDSTLSVILSKALLLAADAKIADPTILRQIGAT